MSITRIQQKHGSTGTYAQTSTVWTINLNSNPQEGNCLLLYLCSKTSLTISSIVQGGSSAAWSLLTSQNTTNRFTYVYALPNVPSGSTSTITMTLGVGAALWCTIIEEVRGLTSSSVLDQTSTANGATTNTYTTGTTSATTTTEGYWVNIYDYYNASIGTDAAGSSPTNDYTIYSAGNPVIQASAGWVGNVASPQPPFNDSFGMIVAYKTVTSTGTAGGNITDSNATSSNYLGIAIALKGSGRSDRRRITASFM